MLERGQCHEMWTDYNFVIESMHAFYFLNNAAYKALPI